MLNRKIVDAKLVHESAHLAIKLVDYIIKMNPEDLRNVIALVNEKNSWGSWLFNKMPAILSVPVQTSLEIADKTFTSDECIDGSINAQIIRELVKKSEGDTVEKELKQEHIAKLNLFVHQKLCFEIEQAASRKNAQNNAIEIKPVIEPVTQPMVEPGVGVDVKADVNVKSDELEKETLIKREREVIQPVAVKQEIKEVKKEENELACLLPSQEWIDKKNKKENCLQERKNQSTHTLFHNNNGDSTKPPVCRLGQIKQPSSKRM